MNVVDYNAEFIISVGYDIIIGCYRVVIDCDWCIFAGTQGFTVLTAQTLRSTYGRVLKVHMGSFEEHYDTPRDCTIA